MNDESNKRVESLRIALAKYHYGFKQHMQWVEAQKNGGYAAPVVRLSDRKVIDHGRPFSKEDGLVRH